MCATTAFPIPHLDPCTAGGNTSAPVRCTPQHEVARRGVVAQAKNLKSTVLFKKLKHTHAKNLKSTVLYFKKLKHTHAQNLKSTVLFKKLKHTHALGILVRLPLDKRSPCHLSVEISLGFMGSFATGQLRILCLARAASILSSAIYEKLINEASLADCGAKHFSASLPLFWIWWCDDEETEDARHRHTARIVDKQEG